MSSITAYMIDNDGYYDCTRSGDVETILLAAEIENKEYTMQRPPTEDFKWRWVDNEWIADETAE